VLAASACSRIVIISQAPGRKVHESGVPWQDQSGDNLCAWLGVDAETFYEPEIFALIPMGFCYPGTGKCGDLPPRPECAPLWHPQLFASPLSWHAPPEKSHRQRPAFSRFFANLFAAAASLATEPHLAAAQSVV